MIKSKLKLDKIEYIHHVSDIHIRNYKRHEEYNKVFQNLYEKLKSYDTKNHLICLTGDIVHSKTDVSPELFQEVQKFLNSLAEIAPVLLIPGNHDANLNNSHRMDSLTPIVNAINNDNIEYFKDSGVMEIGNVHFYHWSVFGGNYEKPDPKQNLKKICLFHGTVDNSTTEVGFVLHNQPISAETFRGFDIVLLGDIHKLQYLNENKTIAYPGSLIQQNHGESLDHGYLLWKVSDCSSQFVKIDNETAFYTVEIDSGVSKPIPETVPKNVYLRMRYKNTDQALVRDIVDEIRRSRNIIEISMQRVNDFTSNKQRSVSNSKGIDLRSVEEQRTLLSKYLKQKYKIEDEELFKVYEINDQVDRVLSKGDIPRNSMWIPKTFEFENMFSYGKNNSIDFRTMKGVYGLFAPNASGKSTLLDSLTYCIFDKCTKTNRGHQVMNSTSNSFYCKLNFELNGLDYYVIRDAKRQKSGNVRVEVDFYYIDEDGNKVSLNGKDRSDTNNNIKAVLGNYEDFVLTTLSTQSNNTGFIDMNQKDRKDLLCQFMDIGVFEEMYNVANDWTKDKGAVLRHYQKNDYESKLVEYENDLKNKESLLEENSKIKKDTDQKKQVGNNKIVELATSIQKVDSSIIDEEAINKKLKDAESVIDSLKNLETETKNKQEETDKKIKDVSKEIEKTNETKLLEKQGDCSRLKNTVLEVSLSLQKLDSQVKHKREKMEKLKELKYDPNCKYCMENVFVKDAIKTKNEIADDVQSLEELTSNKELLEKDIEKCERVETQLQGLSKLQKQLSQLQKEALELESLLESTHSKKLKQSMIVEDCSNKLNERKRQLSTIKNNEKINLEIAKIKKDLEGVETDSKAIDKLVESLNIDIKICKNNIENTEKEIKNRKDLENEYKYYQYYLEATHRDGIPHDLISATIPQIEEEVNNILSQLVDFRIIFETDDKNVNAYIAYSDEHFWPLELTSGMEKFVSSLAIRTALISISTLPRPNFVAIDEGFGALDKSNLGSMSLLFDYLKTQFRFIVIISHIDSMRDIVDAHIEINKHKGKSYVKYK